MNAVLMAGFAALLAGAAPAMAETFVPPKGCTVFVTVQARGCKVSHHYICQGDAKGDQWRVDVGLDGPYFASRIDRETRWMQSYDLISGSAQQLMPDAPDSASFSGLLRTGTDTYDFAQIDDRGGITRVRGFDTLTGNKVTIDGIVLEETSFEFSELAADGRILSTARGREYIHRDWRLFFSGPSEWDGGEGFEPYDRSPARFDLPGDAGFLSNTPEFDCDEQLAALQIPEGRP